MGRRDREAGFTIIEVLISIVVLGVVAAGLAQGLALSSALIGDSRIESMATSLASAELERAQAMPYDAVGVVGGNPPGTIPASRVETVRGRDFTIAWRVRFVDDTALGQPQTGINYKGVEVTVTPEAPDDGSAVTETSIVAPPAFGAIAGKATVTATVTDPFTETPTVMPNVAVTLDGSTSATRTDNTDATGAVAFAGLLPSADDPGNPQYAYRLSAALNGYVVRTPADQLTKHLAPSERWGPVPIEIFKPATIGVTVRDGRTGGLVTRASQVTVATPDPVRTATRTGTSGTFDFDEIDGGPIEPSRSNFTVTATAYCYSGSASQQEPVPAAYPTSMRQNFELTLQPLTELAVTVVRAGTATPLAGASVSLSGGDSDVPAETVSTDASGVARFCVPPTSTAAYVAYVTAPGHGAGTRPVAVGDPPSASTRLDLVAGPDTATVRVTHPSSNRRVRLVAQLGTYDLATRVGTSGNPRRVDVGGLAAGVYYCQFDTTGTTTGTPVWSAPAKSVIAVAGARRNCTLP